MTEALAKASTAGKLQGRKKLVVEVAATKLLDKEPEVDHVGLTTMDILESPPSDIKHVDIPWEGFKAVDLEL